MTNRELIVECIKHADCGECRARETCQKHVHEMNHKPFYLFIPMEDEILKDEWLDAEVGADENT